MKFVSSTTPYAPFHASARPKITGPVLSGNETDRPSCIVNTVHFGTNSNSKHVEHSDVHGITDLLQNRKDETIVEECKQHDFSTTREIVITV